MYIENSCSGRKFYTGSGNKCRPVLSFFIHVVFAALVLSPFSLRATFGFFTSLSFLVVLSHQWRPGSSGTRMRLVMTDLKQRLRGFEPWTLEKWFSERPPDLNLAKSRRSLYSLAYNSFLPLAGVAWASWLAAGGGFADSREIKFVENHGTKNFAG